MGAIVQRLGRLYFNNRGNFAFPYAFLIGWLERENVLRQMRLGQGLDRHDDWLLRLMLEQVRVGHKECYDAYMRIDVESWRDVGSRLAEAKLLVFQARHQLVTMWLDRADAMDAQPHERAELAQLAPLIKDHTQELIPLVETLHGDAAFTQRRRALTRDLRELDARLTRMCF